MAGAFDALQQVNDSVEAFLSCVLGGADTGIFSHSWLGWERAVRHTWRLLRTQGSSAAFHRLKAGF